MNEINTHREGRDRRLIPGLLFRIALPTLGFIYLKEITSFFDVEVDANSTSDSPVILEDNGFQPLQTPNLKNSSARTR